MPRETDIQRRAAGENAVLFHPREIAFCGYSGSGKTTLISRLLGELNPDYSVGYVKHDSHRFTMDVPGKDTFQARHHGASTVSINDSDHWAVVSNGPPPLDALRAIYAPLDLVFVEGLKESPLRKVVLIDDQASILEPVNLAAIGSIVLFVGTRHNMPSLHARYIHRDDIASIKRHVLTVLGVDRIPASEARLRKLQARTTVPDLV